jgi:hypothetical protein
MSHLEILKPGHLRQVLGEVHPEIVKHHPKVMAWPASVGKGDAPLSSWSRRCKLYYRYLLDEELELFKHQHKTIQFLQNEAPCLKAEVVTQ